MRLQRRKQHLERLLPNLLSEQNLPEKHKILVICSGCTDRTPQIVKKFQEKDARIELLNENVRKGKSNALNKIFSIARAYGEILILVNADALPGKDTINKLVSKLENPQCRRGFRPASSPQSLSRNLSRNCTRDMAFAPYNLAE